MKRLDYCGIRLMFIGLIMAIVLVGIELANGATITVGPDVGSDFDIIQAGIDTAIDGDIVLVAPGEYIITEPITFLGKAITVKSEAGPDETTIRMSTPVDPNRGSVVLFENSETDDSVLDGFTITGGQGCPFWLPYDLMFVWLGGGIYFNASSGTVRHCTIVQNITDGGGGVCCLQNASVTMIDCTIAENVARLAGGGVLCGENSSSINMTHCIIVGNIAGLGGGGLQVWTQASATVTNCVIAQNVVVGGGGGGIICAPYGNPNCFATVTNSIFRKNTATEGPDIWVRGEATLDITYSNVVGGQNRVSVEDGAEDGILIWGVGNIDANPCFAKSGYWADINDPNVIVEPDDPYSIVWIHGDYHLKSEAGRWSSASSVRLDPNSDSWMLDDVTSPCIDRGDPNSSVGDEPMPNGGIINMGAYGGTREASMSAGPVQPLPLAHWRLNETEGIIAHEIIGDKNGACHGEPLWQPAGGKAGGALQFDGIDDYVSTPFVLNPGEISFSVTAWIRGGAPGQVIISQADVEGQSAIESGSTWLGINPSNGGLMTGLMDIFFGPLESESVVADEQWHHIGLVYDYSAMRRHLYVDGAEVAVDAGFVGGIQSNAGHYFGAGQILDDASFYSGLIDDVCIYPMALSAEEIAALAQ